MTTERKKHHPVRRKKAEASSSRRDDRAQGNGRNGNGRNSSTRNGDARRSATQGKSARNPRADERDDEDFVDEFEPRRQRRALSHVGGKVTFTGGSDEEREALAHALDVSSDEEDVMSDVHGFHSYPARLHPITARRLIEGFSKPGGRVLDPFCGSGTVVLEARALGRQALGNDLNPLAVELSWLKSRGPTPKLVEDMVRGAASIAEVAEERRLAKADPYRLYDEDDRERYPIHLLLELDSLAHGIDQLSGTEVKRMLRLVISSMLTKLSHSEGDTTRRKAPRRLPSGFAIHLFTEKTSELAERLRAYVGRLPDKAPRAHVGNNDARALEHIESDSVDLIVTSPPYPGVYDYLDHHMHRIRWLGLRAARLNEGEIGARRNYRRLRLDDAAAEWRREIGPTLYELRRTLTNDGRGILVIADSVADRQALRADDQVRLVAEKAGIDITCIASQERPLFLYGADEAFSDRPRLEHVVVFRPTRNFKVKVPKEVLPQNRERPERFRKFDESKQAEARKERPFRRREDSESRDFRPRDDRGRPPPRAGDDRGERSFRSRDDRSSPDRPQRPSQDRTWGSRPSGPGKPRSKSARKPK